MAGNRPWTEHETNVLSEMFSEGRSDSEIGAAVGRTESAVRYRRISLDLRRPKPLQVRNLTDDEERYVKEHYRRDTVHKMAKDLGISWETIRNRMSDMGLSVRLEDNGWSDADVERLRRLAAAGKSCGEMADALDRTENAIYLKCRKLGIVIYTDNRRWTAEELDYLRRNWGYASVSSVARAVHRSVDAVCQRAHKMKLGPVYGLSEDIPLSMFCENTGISRDRVRNTLVPKYGFPLISRKYGKRQYYYFVGLDEVLSWMERHPGLYDGAKVRDGFFAVEPDWLRRKKREDRRDNSHLGPNTVRRAWTTQETSNVKVLAGMGYSYEQIAERVGRSPTAVRNKLLSMGCAYTMKRFWKGREFKYLREHWQTESDEEIARALGRTAASIGMKRLEMGFRRDGCLTDDDMAFVSEHWTDMSDEELAEHVGKTDIAVRNARLRMGLDRTVLRQARPWADDELSYVMKNWEHMSDGDMAVTLGRPVTSLVSKRKELGLYRKSMKKSPHK